MKLSLCAVVTLAAQSALAFTPSLTTSSPSSTTSLHLFGGGGKKEGEGGGGGGAAGMMNQLAMFKKAQEVAQKKKKIDEELSATPFEAATADGKVKASFKYVPVMNPMDPNPDYEAVSFTFDDEFYESASNEDLAKACQEVVLNGIKEINEEVAKKYQVLQADLMEAFQGGNPPAGASS